MKYVCTICGYVYDEAKEGKPFSELDKCPVCQQPVSKFAPVDEPEEASPEVAQTTPSDLAYDPAFTRNDPTARYMAEIHEMAVTGESIHAAMGTLMPLPKWEDILLLGAQLDPAPLNDGDPVNTTTIIGKNAAKPMVLDSPVYISHMSFGALSKEIKVALAKGSAMAGTAMCSGEGGILPEEKAAAYKYIFEYIPNKYSVTDENLQASDAIEIKIGQGTKPGMGGHLPGKKVTPEIAEIRGKKVGEDVQSPSKFPEINSKEDLKAMVDMLRERSGGRPIGIKIAAGNIEQDLAHCVYAEPDFITIDGRGGATGSSPYFLREATTVPTIYALARARKYLDAVASDIALVITGGLRVSADFAKAIAMGADAVAVASAALIAAACQQYRICGSGHCPVGIATQDPELRARLDVEAAAKRVYNYLHVSNEELKTFARISGLSDVHDLGVRNLITTDESIARYTPIRHAGEPCDPLSYVAGASARAAADFAETASKVVTAAGNGAATVIETLGNVASSIVAAFDEVINSKSPDETAPTEEPAADASVTEEFEPTAEATAEPMAEPVAEPDPAAPARYRCKICTQEFEIAPGEEVICPLCKATGDNLELLG